ncbi:hypothetical protein HHK36_000611 [Tetracentron sinense]|uniref:Uncharacterized protein n=1 Tax=Tetracentron sinense TaxID=13715 RepID=A0A834ZWN9_TETSI|nr:hypothetical protein HHK36_000611 [Tetracentron sinense]
MAKMLLRLSFKNADPIFFRLNELTTRPAASEDACGYLGKLQQSTDRVLAPLQKSTITCQKFEELCGDLWEKSFIPFKEVLKHSGLKVDEVELIGNATHVQSYRYSSRDLTSPIKANLYLSLSKSGILSLDQVDVVIEQKLPQGTIQKETKINCPLMMGLVMHPTPMWKSKVAWILIQKKLKKRTFRVPLKVKAS